MSKKEKVVQKRKLNLPALISLLLFLLVPPLFLIPWSRLFILRSDVISTILIHVIGLFVIGLLMLTLGVIALVLAKKHKGLYKGNWLGVLGVIFGGIFFAVGGFFIIDYLLNA
ncbi:MAG TPA: hypothetical protein PK883_10525 [Anaerolineaceae bacterium]|nr:hypothetical protein [Anaerolineaceae bacterium]